MTLRTPRRRISPRTKRKLRAIKNFFRIPRGTSQEYSNNTNSSIEVSVSELKSKIDILEEQLDRVSKHCQDLETLKQTISKETENLTRNFSREQEDFRFETIQKPKKSDRHLKKVETELLYQNSSRELRAREKRDKAVRVSKHEERNGLSSYETTSSKNVNDIQFPPKDFKLKKSYERNENFHEQLKNQKHKYNTIGPTYSPSDIGYSAKPAMQKYDCHEFSGHRQRKHHRNVYSPDVEEFNHQPDYERRHTKKQESSRKKRREYRELDDDFITEIINKQYRPVKLFGKRHSDFSQFSAPVCRDQEFNMRNITQEGTELCSCCYSDHRKQKHRYIRSSDLSDMRSICDTRLYGSRRHRSPHRRYVDDYNNERLYDIVPVKEKSSPKSRRKFAEDNLINYRCKVVPPSPRTQRPRLNLKVHNYTAFEDRGEDRKYQNLVNSPLRENCGQIFNRYESDFTVESARKNVPNDNFIKMNTHKPAQIQEEVGTMSSLQIPNFNNDQINISKDTTLNTQVTNSTADKTDKTLGEIKDILQNFLQEIKKESTHDEKSNITNKIDENGVKEEQQNDKKTNMNTLPNSGQNFNYNMGQCSPSFLPTFPIPNPCCYPIVPMNMCPMNCLHNSYIIPNPSLTCTACAKNSKDNTCLGKECCNDKSKTSQEIKTNNETQELIKEIYRFVSQNTKSVRKTDENYNKTNNVDSPKNEQRKNEKTILTNRSVGSTKAYKHDANVGTPNMKSYSKSCEAFGSRMASDTYHATNASYSDTVLEKLSLEASLSSTESDISSDTPMVKDKMSKFKKVLQSLKLLKKKKDVIEEVRESRSSAESNEKRRPPFQQHITNYAVHDQEFFHPPPIPKQHFCPAHPSIHPHNYDSRKCYQQYLSHNEVCKQHKHYCDPINPHCNPTRYSPGSYCPNYDLHYNQIHTPQVPLCLKEIEVKSIGTQSIRKMSLFRKFTKRKDPEPRQHATQQYSSPVPPNKPTFWKSLQDKAKQQNTDPLDFSLKTQKQLAQGDMKLRNAMLKKLFYKRNPFSPRNLIVKTLLGRDKSSFGNPPKMYKPRMFL